MKIEKTEWSKDVYGFYILPFLGFSKTPDEGRTAWIGWGPYLFKVYVK